MLISVRIKRAKQKGGGVGRGVGRPVRGMMALFLDQIPWLAKPIRG